MQASNSNGLPTSWTTLGTTVTLAAVPPAPSIPAVAVTSISVSISLGSDPFPTKYAIQISSSGWSGYVAGNNMGLSGVPVYQSTSSWSGSGTIWVTGLSTNTAYTFSVSAQNMSGVQTAYGASVSSATLAIPVAGLTVNSVYISTSSISWASSDPSNTRFEVYESTDNFAANFSTPIALASGFTATTTTLISLQANTTYWFRLPALSIMMAFLLVILQRFQQPLML